MPDEPKPFWYDKPHPDEGKYPDAICTICGEDSHSTAWHRRFGGDDD